MMSRKRRSAADEPHLLVRTHASRLHGGTVIADHAHDWHQLVHVTAGLMTVWTEAGSWLAPPGRGVWVPAGTRHSIRFVGESALGTAWLRPGWCADLPDRCTAIAVSPLLRELLLRAGAIGMLDEREVLDQAMAILIQAEFRAAETPPFTLERPTSPALRDAADRIAAGAPEAANVAALARAVGVGHRNFERLFLVETGMTPGRWRQQHGLLAALERLAAGVPIKIVAAEAGYASASAFTAAFRRCFGTTPARYFAEAPINRS